MIKNNKEGFPHHLRGTYPIHALALVEAYLYVFYKFNY
jgi:hypothetical protein